jgi:hypothetical protein
MNAGMQRLDPAVHDFGKPGQVRHVTDRKSRRLESRAGAARGNQFHAESHEIAGKLHQSALSETDSRARRIRTRSGAGWFLETTAIWKSLENSRVSPAARMR